SKERSDERSEEIHALGGRPNSSTKLKDADDRGAKSLRPKIFIFEPVVCRSLQSVSAPPPSLMSAI
ncbi:hypothetical protein, partial [Jiella marina]|uniref:hypothetical protein n=1 Tax=Jiella sp. LLJ827 TaxID=2917712 RepID=UPI002101D1A0